MNEQRQDAQTQPVPPAAPAQAPAAPPVVAATVKPSSAPSRVDRLPAYRVLLHNDNVNDIVDVVETICDLTPLNLNRAAAATLEAHNTGVALLLTTHRERAELYVEQFRSKKLTVTIEPGE